jgi:hypothetical protein
MHAMRKLMLLVSFALALPATAQTMTSQLQACQAIPDAQQRLACYDRISRGQPPAAPGVVSAVPRNVIPDAAPGPVPALADKIPPQRAPSLADAFGAEALPRTQATRRALESITSAITDLSYTASTKFVVTLANGQVWRQKDGDVTTTFFHKNYRTATISRGALGSYNLTFNGSGSYYKVARVR